tara:strand:+ start:140 stop:673 length:534 start_codon:yes stop_codon:yes gene_type:complete
MRDLNSLTVKELKQLLREQDLTVSGNKSELISRLEEFQEDFLSLNDEGTTAIVISNPKEIIEETSIEKKETYCPSCSGILRYPSDYQGTLTCPRCKYSFKVKANLNLGMFLTVLPFISLLLTIIITFIVSEKDSTPEGQLGSGMAAAGFCMGGMILSGIFLAVAMIYAMTRKPVNLG